MKSPSLALFNSIGFANDNQKMVYLASLLMAGLTASPAVDIRAAVAAVTAKPAIASTPTAIAANARFPGSPAYAVGAAVPAVSAVAAVAAIKSPTVVPLAGWSNGVNMAATPTEVTVTAYVPFSQVGRLYGSPTDGVNSVREITPSAMQATAFLDTLASNTPTAIVSIPDTVEKALYSFALTNPDCTIVDEIYNGVLCHKIVLIADATAYDPTNKNLQLPKLATVGGGGLE